MYRGVIQHVLYVTTYLRKQILERGLEKPLDKGRIYRVLPENSPRRDQPKLSKASASELVETLSHPSGWWRDTAQRLLVEQNAVSIAPQLKELLRSSSNMLLSQAGHRNSGIELDPCPAVVVRG